MAEIGTAAGAADAAGLRERQQIRLALAVDLRIYIYNPCMSRLAVVISLPPPQMGWRRNRRAGDASSIQDEI